MESKMIKRTLLAAALTVGISTSANAALVINGGFESGPDTGGSFVTLGTGDTSITGGTVTDGSIDYIGGYLPGAGGTHNIQLSGAGPRPVFQTRATGRWPKEGVGLSHL